MFQRDTIELPSVLVLKFAVYSKLNCEVICLGWIDVW